MLIKGLLEKAIEHNLVDLQALIMFLVFEKEVLSMDDEKSSLNLYYLPKHRERMNHEISEYKKKMGMNYTLNVYEIKTGYHTIYVQAMNEGQAKQHAFNKGYKPTGTKAMDDDLLMVTENRKNDEIYARLKDLKQDITPKILGGF